MANQDGGRVRAIDWAEVFPWLILFRSLRIAVQLRLLVLCAAAALLTVTGWALLGLVFSGDESIGGEMKAHGGCPWRSLTETIANDPGRGPVGRPEGAEPSILARPSTPGWGAVGGWRGPFWDAWEPLFGTWEQLGRPFYRIFDRGVTFTRAIFLFLCGLWGVAVWGYFGGATTRAAAYELATGQRLGVTAILRHAAVHWRAHVAAVLFPLGVMALLTGLLFVGGLVLRLELFGVQFGAFVAGVLWILALVVGAFLAVLALGLFFGWPLLWAGLGAEQPDSYDVIGRAYRFVYQRPLHFLFYVVVAALLGSVGWVLISMFVSAVVGLTWWGVSWGSGAARVQQLLAPSGPGSAGGVLIRFWVDVVKLLGAGFLFSYFWTAMTAVYLLLRRAVDGNDLEDVFIEEEKQVPLPPLRTDSRGAPEVGVPNVPAPTDLSETE